MTDPLAYTDGAFSERDKYLSYISPAAEGFGGFSHIGEDDGIYITQASQHKTGFKLAGLCRTSDLRRNAENRDLKGLF